MATNHTEHYQLNLWEPTDYFLREEFNENSRKLDTALMNLADSRVRMVTGSYPGTGQGGADHPNVIEIPDAERPPQVIIVSEDRGWYHLFLIRGMPGAGPINVNGVYELNVTWTDKGVKWYSKKSDAFGQFNSNNTRYYYVAFI